MMAEPASLHGWLKKRLHFARLKFSSEVLEKYRLSERESEKLFLRI